MYKLEDRKIIFEDSNLFSHLPFLGDGSHADVYKFRIGKEIYALKVFNGLYKENIKDYEPKLDINIESYISPIKLLYVNDKFKGYIMRFCQGKDLEKRPKLSITVDEFARSASKLFDDTKKLTELKYSIYDSFISNVMYDNGFKMIDMDSYPYEINKSYSEIEDLNNIRLNQMLTDIFINSTGLAEMFFKNVDLKKKLANCTSGKILFEELFNQICIMAYNITDEEIVNVSDIGKVLKKNKNNLFIK